MAWPWKVPTSEFPAVNSQKKSSPPSRQGAFTISNIRGTRSPEPDHWEGSAQANLTKDALAGEHLRKEANEEAHHGQTAIPGFCKINEAEAGRGGVRHGKQEVRDGERMTGNLNGQAEWSGSAEANLAKDALAGEHLRKEANEEAHHGQAAIPGFCKINEAEAGRGGVRHGPWGITGINHNKILRDV